MKLPPVPIAISADKTDSRTHIRSCAGKQCWHVVAMTAKISLETLHRDAWDYGTLLGWPAGLLA